MEEASIPDGTVIGGRWRIQGFLGAGGFGQVLLAEDISAVGLGHGAVKVLHPNTTPQERQAFLSEVKKIAVLRHQNLVGYLDSGQLHFDGHGLPDLGGEIRPYLVTELCQGSLDDRISDSPHGALSAEETFVVLQDTTAGLAHLHERGMIHRDIKPGNVLFADGQWKLADFGLMRDLSASGTYHRGELLIGTPLFMAPELFSTMMATAPSDVYALGVLAHLCATGRPLHAGAGPALVHNIATSPPAIDPSIDQRLGQMIQACTQAQPGARPTAVQLNGWLRSAVAVPTAPSPATEVAGRPAPLVNVSQPAPQTRRQPLPNPSRQVAPAAAHAQTPAQDAARGKRTAVLVAIGALVVVSAMTLAAAALALWATSDDTAAAGGRDAPSAVQPTSTNPNLDAPPDSATANNTGTGTDTDTDTDTDTGTGTGTGDSADPVPAAELTNVGSHFDNQPCAEDGPLNQVRITNRHTEPVDYDLTVDHFNADGVKIAEAFDTVRALPPEHSALLGMKSSEEGAARCEVATFTAVATDPKTLSGKDEAQIVSCVLDEFFGNWYDITYTVGNPSSVTAIVEAGFGIVDADGLRIDESFGHTTFGVDPGTRVQQEASQVFWNMDEVDQEPVECIITWVEVERDPTS